MLLGLSLSIPQIPRRAASAAGASDLLAGEANGFAADFTWPTDAKRVAVKVSSVVTEYALDAFFGNAGTSPKLVYDVTGALVWSPHNMVLQSENFLATWTLSGTPIFTAHTIQDDDPAAAEAAIQNAVAGHILGETYTFTAWVLKDAVTSRFPGIWISGVGTRVIHLDTSTGATATETGTLAGSSAVVSDGVYWKVTITYVCDQVTMSVRLFPARSTVIGTVNNAAVGTVTIDKVQINRGATQAGYLTTTTAARFGLALDYDPVTHAAKGLLVEPAATNLLLNNAALSTQSVTVTAVAHTLSFFGTGTITLSGVSTAGPLVGTGAANRVSLTFTPTAGSLTCTVTGSVTRAQLEIGSIATSLIPTFAASATRAVDKYSCTPSQINHSATAGSWWGEATPLVASLNERVVGYTTGGAAPLFWNTNQFGLYDAVALQKSVAWAYGATHKSASAFASGDRATTGNGATILTDAGSTVSLLNPGASIIVGNDGAGFASSFNGYIRKVFYLPRRMSNAELVSKTA